MITLLTGLAYTSPAVAVLAIDHAIFKVHIYKTKQLAALHLFLQSNDNRKSIVFVTSINDLYQIQDEKDIFGFVLFEDIELMNKISNINILDATSLEDVWSRKLISPKELNSALDKECSTKFEIPQLDIEKNLTKDVTFRSLVVEVEKMLKNEELALNFVENACKYASGLHTKRNWTAKVRKPLLASGISVETMVELEKWLDATSDAKSLKKAYTKLVETGWSVDKAANEYKADVTDLAYIVEVIGVEKKSKK